MFPRCFIISSDGCKHSYKTQVAHKVTSRTHAPRARIFLDFPQNSNMCFDFHTLVRYFLTFGNKSPEQNKTMPPGRTRPGRGGGIIYIYASRGAAVPIITIITITTLITLITIITIIRCW